MKNKKTVFFLIGALLIAGIIFFMTKMGNEQRNSVSSSAKSGKKILYYRAPMDPNYISDKPGKSPMGMDLVPVYEGEEAPAGTVKIDPTTVQDIGVRTAKIDKRVLKRDIRTVGRVTYDEQKVAYVNTKIGGWIEKLYVDYEGQKVKKGDPLYDIYSPELVATQEEYLLALEYERKMRESKIKEISERAQSLLEAARKRLVYWDVPQEDIDEIARTGEVKKAMRINSPISGVVVHKGVLEGQFVKPGENLYRIADLSRVWVYADIYEYELPWIKTGQDTEMTLSYIPGKTYTGSISYIYPYLEGSTRTAKVRLEFDNSSGELKPDMYADVRINTAPSEPVLAVPKEAVIHAGDRDVIIIDKGRGYFEPRNIVTGMDADDYYELLKGAKEGELVVTSAQFLIDSESQLNEALSKMLKSQETDKGQMKMPMRAGKNQMEMSAPAKESTQTAMDDIWSIYFYLQNKLAEDSLAAFPQKAQIIGKDIEEILASDNDKKIVSLAEQIKESLPEISSHDIVQVRDGFWKLSETMISYMKDLDAKRSREKGYKLFYCGMQKKYWVQKGDAVSNPYNGAKMVTCGADEAY